MTKVELVCALVWPEKRGRSQQNFFVNLIFFYKKALQVECHLEFSLVGLKVSDSIVCSGTWVSLFSFHAMFIRYSSCLYKCKLSEILHRRALNVFNQYSILWSGQRRHWGRRLPAINEREFIICSFHRYRHLYPYICFGSNWIYTSGKCRTSAYRRMHP